MALDTTKTSKAKAESDIYTALLGLAILALAGAVGYVCFQSMGLFGTLFGKGL